MSVQIICKSHKDLIKTKQAMLQTRSNMVVFGTQGQVTPKWKSPIWLEFEPVTRFYGCPGYPQF